MREDLQIDFSREKFFGRFFGTLPRNVSIQSLPPSSSKKKTNWAGLFEICFRSSKMTEPRPWTYLEIYCSQRRHTKLKPTTNYQLQKSIFLNPPCTKVFGTTPYTKGGGGLVDPPVISKTVNSTNFNFGRPLGLSMRGKKPVELMI